MGYIIVISLPVILFFLITAIACYLFGRARGRQQSTGLSYGPPAPAPPPFGPQFSGPDKSLSIVASSSSRRPPRNSPFLESKPPLPV
ncbi:Unknown protein [Striga hermonthica]|uniref:Uncharacterized protein n=1 Tax=Striga hermonthica TaxID=68872 RepID=A0A9N7NK45_STRHE|nr:Unknown protein [Striga hermonthica]